MKQTQKRQSSCVKTQEAYRQCHILSMACAARRGGGGGSGWDGGRGGTLSWFWLGWRYAALIPVLVLAQRRGEGTPVLVLAGVEGVPLSYPWPETNEQRYPRPETSEQGYPCPTLDQRPVSRGTHPPPPHERTRDQRLGRGLELEIMACSHTRRWIWVWIPVLGDIPKIVLWLQLYYAESSHRTQNGDGSPYGDQSQWLL